MDGDGKTMFARAFCQESKNAFRFVSFRRVLLERNNFARISRFILVFVRNDKRTEPRNNAIVDGGGGRPVSSRSRNETKARSEAFPLVFLCVTHWFLSYRASVSDTPYLVDCNDGVRRCNITCHVQRRYGNLDSVRSFALTLSVGERAPFLSTACPFDSFSATLVRTMIDPSFLKIRHFDLASKSRVNYSS